MAAEPAFLAALTRMGFSNAARTIITDPERENLRLGDLIHMDDDQVEALCSSLRKPGGTIPNPAGGQGARIPNPGTYIPARAEDNLKAACFLAKHYARTDRTLTAALLVMPRIRRYATFKVQEANYKEPDDHMKLETPNKIWDFIENFPEHLGLYNGQESRPLNYVIRTEIEIPDAEAQPPFGEPDSPFTSVRDEVISRCPHDDVHFPVDNTRVWELLKEAVQDHKHVYNWIKAYAKNKNGRAAWMTFKAHYRG